MVFYHGTTEEAWRQIQEEGVLFGVRGTFMGREVSRCTYLAKERKDAEIYGDVILEVEYEPKTDSTDNNYFDNECWQIRVYVPIPLKNVRRVDFRP